MYNFRSNEIGIINLKFIISLISSKEYKRFNAILNRDEQNEILTTLIQLIMKNNPHHNQHPQIITVLWSYGVKLSLTTIMEKLHPQPKPNTILGQKLPEIVDIHNCTFTFNSKWIALWYIDFFLKHSLQYFKGQIIHKWSFLNEINPQFF